MGIIEIRDDQTGKTWVDWRKEGAHMSLTAPNLDSVISTFRALGSSSRIRVARVEEIPRIDDLDPFSEIYLSAEQLIARRGLDACVEVSYGPKS